MDLLLCTFANLDEKNLNQKIAKNQDPLDALFYNSYGEKIEAGRNKDDSCCSDWFDKTR